MSRRSRMDQVVADNDMSALTVLGILVLLGLWPIAVLLMFFGLIGSLLSDD